MLHKYIIKLKYELVKEVISLLEEFERTVETNQMYSPSISGFKNWISDSKMEEEVDDSPDWEGKVKGRSPESVISTLLVHMNRYAKNYSKAAMHGSTFSTQEEFIYLINLRAFGAMSKMDLIKKNVQDKASGMKIIDRLLKQGWINQQESTSDKRSKLIELNAYGEEILEAQMHRIRQASNIVAGRLSHKEKMDLIKILNKLDHFHLDIFNKNLDPTELQAYVEAYDKTR